MLCLWKGKINRALFCLNLSETHLVSPRYEINLFSLFRRTETCFWSCAVPVNKVINNFNARLILHSKQMFLPGIYLEFGNLVVCYLFVFCFLFFFSGTWYNPVHRGTVWKRSCVWSCKLTVRLLTYPSHHSYFCYCHRLPAS